MSSSSPEQCAEAFSRLDAECRAIGRDPAEVRHSAMVGLLMGADDAEVARRVRDQLAMVGDATTDAVAWLEAHRPRWIMGKPDEARAMVARFAAAGVERIMLQDMLPRDHAMIELAARELIGRV
jgi:alkanesulfonate monooxygenase SsuD/methylene tetrahydromethanopterin reductase-like flavin-dependent oxidoreductase (luciferase family)